jgi:hypothetical protein
MQYLDAARVVVGDDRIRAVPRPCGGGREEEGRGVTEHRTIPGEDARPTDAPLASTPQRPDRARLHGADCPWGYHDNRGASLSTVRRGP